MSSPASVADGALPVLAVTPVHEGRHSRACDIGILEAAGPKFRPAFGPVDRQCLREIAVLGRRACGDNIKRGAGSAPVDALVLTVRKADCVVSKAAPLCL